MSTSFRALFSLAVIVGLASTACASSTTSGDAGEGSEAFGKDPTHLESDALCREGAEVGATYDKLPDEAFASYLEEVKDVTKLPGALRTAKSVKSVHRFWPEGKATGKRVYFVVTMTDILFSQNTIYRRHLALYSSEGSLMVRTEHRYPGQNDGEDNPYDWKCAAGA